MTPRSIIAMAYVIAAAITAVVNGPGAGALAGELAVFAVFEVPQPGAQDMGIATGAGFAWELDDLPAYLTEDKADVTRAAADLAPGPLLQ